MNSIPFHFTPETDDRCEAARVALSRSVPYFVLRALAVFALIALAPPAAGAYLRDRERLTAGPTIAFALIYLIGAVILLLPTAVWLAARFSMRSRPAPSPISGQADDSGISRSSESGSDHLPWSTFSELVETRKLFLFAHRARRGTFEIIPRRAFHSFADFVAFKELTRATKMQGGFDAVMGNVVRAVVWICVVTAAIPTGMWLTYLLPPLMYSAR